MEKFTPGPWAATTRSGYHEILAPCADTDWYGREKMHAVAYIDTELDDHEALADAYLIAAAPELLEALTEFQRHVIRHSCSWDDAANGSHHHPIWAKVTAALRKATGEPA